MLAPQTTAETPEITSSGLEKVDVLRCGAHGIAQRRESLSDLSVYVPAFDPFSRVVPCEGMIEQAGFAAL
jgi:hypothetical protein